MQLVQHSSDRWRHCRFLCQRRSDLPLRCSESTKVIAILACWSRRLASGSRSLAGAKLAAVCRACWKESPRGWLEQLAELREGQRPLSRPQSRQTERPQLGLSAPRPNTLPGRKRHHSRLSGVSFRLAKRSHHKRPLPSPAGSIPRTPTLPPPRKNWEPELVVARHRLDLRLRELRR